MSLGAVMLIPIMVTCILWGLDVPAHHGRINDTAGMLSSQIRYGLESRLTDLKAGRIIGNVIAPDFKNGRFDLGVMAGVSAIIGTVRGEFQTWDKPAEASGRTLFDLQVRDRYCCLSCSVYRSNPI